MARYEGSKADRASDKLGAKLAKMPLKKFEKTAADKRKDAEGQRMMDKKRGKR
jgi:hypothetical protein